MKHMISKYILQELGATKQGTVEYAAGLKHPVLS